MHTWQKPITNDVRLELIVGQQLIGECAMKEYVVFGRDCRNEKNSWGALSFVIKLIQKAVLAFSAISKYTPVTNSGVEKNTVLQDWASHDELQPDITCSDRS